MRRQRILGFTAVAAFALLVGHRMAVAQAQNGGTPAAPDAVAGVQRQVALSPQEQAAQGEHIVTRMEGARTVVRRQLEMARAQRDVVKTLCLNDKLNQLDVAVRSARERRTSLDAAAQRRDADLTNHEYTILSVLRQRAEQITAEANQCIGQEAAFVGESSVSSTVDRTLPSDPSALEREIPGVIGEPPGCASCVK